MSTIPSLKKLSVLFLTAGVLCAQTATAPLSSQPAATKAASSRAALPSYRDLKYPPLRPIQIPEVQRFTLPNGMKLYLLENHELPLISGLALVRTGNLFDPPDKVGLAEMTGMVMRTGGTTSKTGDQLDEELENMAASVETGIDESSGSVSFSALKDNTDEVLAAFKDLITSPAFRDDKVELAKSQLRSSIARRNDEASGIASREFNDTVYGKDTPYGWSLEYAHVDRIKQDDLIAFYKRYFFPSNIMLAVYGDFSTAEMKAKLEKLFSDWNYQQPPVPPFQPVTATPVPGIFLATKTDVTQTFFRAGHLGGTFRDKDYPALEVMADILGGGFDSRLFKKIRTELGYAYGIGAVWHASYDHPGTFMLYGSTKSQSTTETLKVALQEIEKIRTTEVTGEELKTAKDKVLNSFVFNFDTPSKTLNRLLRYEYYGYPQDFIFQYQKAIEGVTKADVLRVAREHLRPEDMTFIAVGRPSDFDQPLTALNLPVKDIDLTIPQPGGTHAAASEESIRKGREELLKIQNAVGGAEKLAAVKDVQESSVVQLQGPQGPMTVKQSLSWLAPSHLREIQELPFGKITIYFDGKDGWLSSPQGTGAMPPPIRAQAEGELFRQFLPLLLSDRDPERTVNYAGQGALEISNKAGQTVRLEYDETSGLPKKKIYTSVALQGAPRKAVEIFEDWKDVDGIRFPYKVTIEEDGKKFADATVNEIKVNTGLSADALSKKP